MLKLSPSERNNDGEYIDQKFQNYLAAENINWDSRASYVSEQNGEVERLNRTLMYKIRSMLNQIKISRNMWNEIIKTIAYLFNRSSHYQLNDKISYEMIKKTKSNLSHLRIIESTTWVHILKKKIKKLNDRSWQSILVGYENDNQYRIYDSRTGKVHIVRDVKIDESNKVDSDSDSDDDFWTREDDKLLNSNFEVQDSGTITSSKRSALIKKADNRAVSSDLRIGNFDSVRAIDESNELVNALDQML